MSCSLVPPFHRIFPPTPETGIAIYVPFSSVTDLSMIMSPPFTTNATFSLDVISPVIVRFPPHSTIKVVDSVTLGIEFRVTFFHLTINTLSRPL